MLHLKNKYIDNVIVSHVFLKRGETKKNKLD